MIHLAYLLRNFTVICLAFTCFTVTCLTFTGFYCDSFGMSAPGLECDEGYYCPEGQNVSAPAEYICTPGHYCPQGSAEQQACQPGYFQDEFGKVCVIIIRDYWGMIHSYLVMGAFTTLGQQNGFGLDQRDCPANVCTQTKRVPLWFTGLVLIGAKTYPT